MLSLQKYDNIFDEYDCLFSCVKENLIIVIRS